MRFITACYIFLMLFCGFLFAQSPAGQALSLDGSGDYADFGNVTQANFGTADFTIEFWINKPNSRSEAVIGKREICMHHSFWNIRMSIFGGIEIDQNEMAGNHFGISGQDNIANAGWHHIAITRRDSLLKIYLDARLDTTRAGPGTTDIANEAPLLIGENPCVGFDGTAAFSGQIDEVRIWNTARTDSQIEATWLDTLSRQYYATPDSGLAGYWRFDELEDLGIHGDGADDVRDLSVNGNHGDLAGDATLSPSGALTGIEDEDPPFADQFLLEQNYPNPFNPATTIRYVLPQRAFVNLAVYDMLGREVRRLFSETQNAGKQQVSWDGRDNAGQQVASGAYYYRLTVENNFTETKKLLLLK